MARFGPTRKELLFRIVFSVAGLGLLATALAIHGLPRGPAIVEVVVLAGGFFGGTLVWSLLKLGKTGDDG
jgi:hypothetical protein